MNSTHILNFLFKYAQKAVKAFYPLAIIACLMVPGCLSGRLYAQTQMAFWNFQDALNNYTALPYNYNVNLEPSLTFSPAAGTASGVVYTDILSVVHPAGQAASLTNPSSIVIALTTEEFQNIKLRFDYKTAGITNFTLAWSLDNITYTDVQNFAATNNNTWQPYSYDLKTITAINNIPGTVYLRIGNFTGTGSFDFDNLEITGTADLPKLFVTPSALTDLNYGVGTGPSDVQQLLVEGINLTGNLTISGFGNFRWSTNPAGPYTNSGNATLVQSGGYASQIYYIVLVGGLTTVGTYTNTLTISGGGITTTSVTLTGNVTSGNCSDLIISQYAYHPNEGRFIEIYNASQSSVSMANYQIRIYNNGGGTVSTAITLPAATLAAYGSIIYHNNDDAPSGLFNTANLGGTYLANLNFNGNDLVDLRRISPNSILDVIGSTTVPGGDPGTAGWNTTGIGTNGYNLIRKPFVQKGKTSISTSFTSGAAPYPYLQTEWSVQPIDRNNFYVPPTFNAGTHLCSCKIPSPTDALSDIITDAGFTYPQLISPCPYASPLGQTSQDWWESQPTWSLQMARFTLRDDGLFVSSPPHNIDGKPTNMVLLMVEIGNYANLDSVALFAADNSGNPIYFLSAVPAGPTVSFFADILATSRSTSNFVLKATFKKNITDKQRITFKIAGADVFDDASSQFANAYAGSGAITSSAGNDNVLEITATQLVWEQQPTSTTALSIMRPPVVVNAMDACNNIDLDYNGLVTLDVVGATNPCSSLSGGVVNAVNGKATFPNLRPRVTNASTQIIGTSFPVLTPTPFSNVFSVNAFGSAGVTDLLAEWNFNDNNLASDAGLQINRSPDRNLAGQSIVNLKANLAVAEANGFNSTTRAWTVNISTAGYANIKVSSKQQSDLTGPRDFQFQASTDNINWTNVGSAYIVANNFTTGVLSQLLLPASFNDRDSIYLRWRVSSTTTNAGGTPGVAAAAKSYIEDIIIEGVSLGDVDPRLNYFYRTGGSGNYSNPCIWQYSPDNIQFDQAPVYPINTTSSILVQNKHILTHDLVVEVQVDQFTIADSATFILPAGRLLKVTDGPVVGADLILNGTFINESLSGQDITFESPATWQFGASGMRTFVNRGSFDPDNWHNRHHTNWNGTTFNNGQTWELQRKTPGVNPVLSTTITRYPNLIFEDSTGTAWDIPAAGRLRGNSTISIQGRLDVGGTGNGTVTAYNEINSPVFLTLSDSLIIRTGSTFTNDGSTKGYGIAFNGPGLRIDGSLANQFGSDGLFNFTRTGTQTINGSGSFSTGFINTTAASGTRIITYQMTGSNWLTIHKNFNVSNSYTFTNDGTTKGYGLDVKGNITLNASGILNLTGGTGNSGRLRLSGSTPQSITSSNAGQVISLQDLEINNAAGATWDAMTRQSGTFTFTNGIINTNATRHFTMGPNATVGGTPGNSSFINGILRREVNTPFSEYVFPIGRTGFSTPYRPVSVLPTLATTIETFSAEHKTTHPNTDYFGAYAIGRRTDEYWDINKISAGSITARIKLNYVYSNNAANWNPALPNAATNVAVGKYYSGSTAWYLAGEPDPGSSNIIESNPPYIMARNWKDASGAIWTQPISTFSPFGVIYGGSKILPVVILSFSGTRAGPDHLLQWEITDAKEVRSVLLEHSTNGIQFTKLNTPSSVRAKDSYIYHSPAAGVHFYRLAVASSSGQMVYSKTIALSTTSDQTIITGLQQNPVSQRALVQIWSASGQQARATLMDAVGRNCGSFVTLLQKGANSWPITLANGLNDGLFYLKITTDDGVTKVVPFMKGR